MPAMIVLGREHYVQTGLSCEEAAAALKAVVAPGPLFAFDLAKPGGPPLRGKVDGLRFEVVRRTQFRNSFTPVVEGRIVAAQAGSQVQLRHGMHLVPVLGVVAWFVGTVLVAAVATQSEALATSLPVFLALPLVGPAVAYLAFRHEVPAVTQEIALAVTKRG